MVEKMGKAKHSIINMKIKYRWRKVFSATEAKNEIECSRMSIESYMEEIIYYKMWHYSPMILAICHTTIEEAISEAEKCIEYQVSKIEYMRKFLK